MGPDNRTAKHAAWLTVGIWRINIRHMAKSSKALVKQATGKNLGKVVTAGASGAEFALNGRVASLTGLIASILQKPPKNIQLPQVREAIKAGLPRSAFDLIRNNLGTTNEKLSGVVSIPTRTLARRKHFTADESDRLYRVDSVFQKVVEVMEGIEAARRWMFTPQRALNNLTPFECSDTEAGAEEVKHLLGRIEHGVFS